MKSPPDRLPIIYALLSCFIACRARELFGGPLPILRLQVVHRSPQCIQAWHQQEFDCSRGNHSWKLNQREKSKWTKLKLDIQILPDYTEPNNERVAKMAVTLTVENATLEQYQCTAVADISLYDRQAGELVEQTQEERRFGGKHVVRFMMNLGSQERIERSANQHLEVGIKVKVQLRRISSEMADGFVSLVVK